MTLIVRILVPSLLALAVWQVHSVRSQLASEDADPAAVAQLRASLTNLPLVLEDGRYVGTPAPVEPEIVRQAGADSYASVSYKNAQGNSFRLYVGGAIRNQENFHAPSFCMPASGWELLDEGTVPFSCYPSATHEPTMRRLLLQLGNERMLVYYWFQAGNRIANHEWMIRWYRFLDLLAKEPFRPTLIVTVYARVVRDVEQTEEATQEFLRSVGPQLRASIAHGGFQ